MALKVLKLQTLLVLAFSSLCLQVAAQSSFPTNTSNPYLCPSPTGFANSIVRAPLPSSPTLSLTNSFLFEHILFFYTDTNIAISEAAFASFCLDQCIAYQPDPKAKPLPTEGSLPPSYVGNKTGPCLSFTVDMGKPFPPNTNDTALRWYCEAFDKYLAEDLSDYETFDSPGSFMHALGVNRACGGGYRAF